MQASIWRVKVFSFFPHKERYGSSTRELLLINSSHDNKLFLTRVVLVSGPLRSKIFSSWQRSSKGSILDVELWKLNSKWRIRPNMIRTLRERRTSFAQSKSRHKLYFDKGRPGFRFPTLKKCLHHDIRSSKGSILSDFEENLGLNPGHKVKVFWQGSSRFQVPYAQKYLHTMTLENTPKAQSFLE